MEKKIISMYAKEITTNDIESYMRDLWDIEISDSIISRLTDKILPIMKEGEKRSVEEIYAVVFILNRLKNREEKRCRLYMWMG